MNLQEALVAASQHEQTRWNTAEPCLHSVEKHANDTVFYVLRGPGNVDGEYCTYDYDYHFSLTCDSIQGIEAALQAQGVSIDDGWV